MSLPAYHVHGSATIILSKTAQNLQIEAERWTKKTTRGVRRRRKYPYARVRGRRGGVTERTSVTIRICSVYVA